MYWIVFAYTHGDPRGCGNPEPTCLRHYPPIHAAFPFAIHHGICCLHHPHGIDIFHSPPPVGLSIHHSVGIGTYLLCLCVAEAYWWGWPLDRNHCDAAPCECLIGCLVYLCCWCATGGPSMAISASTVYNLVCTYDNAILPHVSLCAHILLTSVPRFLCGCVSGGSPCDTQSVVRGEGW